MLGNLGYSSLNCVNLPVELGSLTVSCSFGSIGEITQFGVSNPGDGNPVDQCLINDINKKCTPNSNAVLQAEEMAIGKSSYQLQWTAASLYTGGAGAGCVDEDSLIFVQYTCVQAAAVQKTKFNELIFAESVAILIGFLFYCLIRMLYQGGKLSCVEWDLSTVTASDYTVMWEIKRETYENWDNDREAKNALERIDDPDVHHDAEGYAFKDTIKKQVEMLLSD